LILEAYGNMSIKNINELIDQDQAHRIADQKKMHGSKGDEYYEEAMLEQKKRKFLD